MRVNAVLFDAYGTLFDVHSMISLAESLYPGHGNALCQAWRAKQLEYTWLRTLSGQYRDFWQVTGDALRWAAASLKLPMSDAAHQRLLDSYLVLKPFPENLDVLRELHAAGLKLGTLSNGTATMLDAALESAGMRGLLTHVLSVDSARCYKTSARAYELGTQALGMPADRIAFVSSNCWDAIGATWYGYRTFWVNRQHAPLEELGASPVGTGSSLSDLPRFLE